jgi:hypothetical protein
MTAYSICRHCGERIVRVNFAMGPSWEHQPDGAAFMDQMTRYCRTTVAEPGVVDLKVETGRVEHADFSPDTGHLHTCEGPGSVCRCAILLYELMTPVGPSATVKVEDVKRLIPHALMSEPLRMVSFDVLLGWLKSCGMNVDWEQLLREHADERRAEADQRFFEEVRDYRPGPAGGRGAAPGE